MLAAPLNERPGDALKDRIPLLPDENERGLEKLRDICGVEKVRVGLEKLRERNALVAPERNLLTLDRFTLDRFALNRLMLNRFVLNRLTLGDVMFERFTLNLFTLDDAILALLVFLRIPLSADILAR